jgi:uncharacterized protein YgbK (DUF1537 family)
MPPRLGVIADDYTGATDVAAAFRREGLRTLLFFGRPTDSHEPPDSDVLVVALKTRTGPPADAVRLSLEALSWLRGHGATCVYFKYCSTFDSTVTGNIGPVLDALAEATAASVVLTTPSTPAHARTQYQGHLFVDGDLLSDSHMRDHPLTPMTDSYLPRMLGAQSAQRVGLVPHEIVRKGADQVRSAIVELAARGQAHLLVDAVDDADLRVIGQVVAGHRLVAGASGLASGVATAFAAGRGERLDAFRDAVPADAVPAPHPAAALVGSCSTKTLAQISFLESRGHPCHLLDVVADPGADSLAERALAWYDSSAPTLPPVIYSSLGPGGLKEVQEKLGVERSARIIEEALGRTAAGLIERGVRRLVIAGGETAGAVVGALQVTAGVVGAEAAPGVPWILAQGDPPLALLLKSGNFGADDLLARALVEPFLGQDH